MKNIIQRLHHIRFRSIIFVLIALLVMWVIFNYLDSLWLKKTLYEDICSNYNSSYTECTLSSSFYCLRIVPPEHISKNDIIICPGCLHWLTWFINSMPVMYPQDEYKGKWGLISLVRISDPCEYQEVHCFHAAVNIIYIRYFIQWNSVNYYEQECQKKIAVKKIELFIDIIDRDISIYYRLKRLLGCNVDRSTLKEKVEHIDKNYKSNKNGS